MSSFQVSGALPKDHSAATVSRLHRYLSPSIRLLALICILIAVTTSARAQESPAKPVSGHYAELDGRVLVWNDQASLDTTPITFGIGEARYKVPRNYIVWMNDWKGGPQTLVRFKVTYPKFEPLDQMNTPCMTLAPVYRPPGCLPVEFIVANGSWSVGGGGWAASDEEAFDNIRDLFHSQTPLPGPHGFELYETGPENARIETYRKRTPEHVLILSCLIQSPDSRATAQCNNQSRLADHNELEFRICFDQLQSAEEIDAGLRSLVKSFSVPATARSERIR